LPVLEKLTESGALDQIREIALDDDEAFDEEFEWVCKMPQLRRLAIYGGTDGPPKKAIFGDKLRRLQNCHSLEGLTVFGAWISDAEFACLPQIPKLRELCLYGFEITNPSIDNVLKQPNLEVLRFESKDINEDAIRRFFVMPKLQAIWCPIQNPSLRLLQEQSAFRGYRWAVNRLVQQLNGED
jgi:hypothetical protein